MSTRRGGQIGLICRQVRTEDRRRTVMNSKAIWMMLAVACHTSTLHHSTSTDSVSNIIIKSGGGHRPFPFSISKRRRSRLLRRMRAHKGWIFAPTSRLLSSPSLLIYKIVLHSWLIRLLPFSSFLSYSFFRTFSYLYFFDFRGLQIIPAILQQVSPATGVATIERGIGWKRTERRSGWKWAAWCFK